MFSELNSNGMLFPPFGLTVWCNTMWSSISGISIYKPYCRVRHCNLVEICSMICQHSMPQPPLQAQAPTPDPQYQSQFRFFCKNSNFGKSPSLCSSMALTVEGVSRNTYPVDHVAYRSLSVPRMQSVAMCMSIARGAIVTVLNPRTCWLIKIYTPLFQFFSLILLTSVLFL